MTAFSALREDRVHGTMNAGALAALVLAHRQVLDCAVLTRVDLGGVPRTIVYVVTTGPIALADVQAAATQAGSALLPDAIARVSSIPLLSDGTVDAAALASIPLVESSAIDALRATSSASSQPIEVDVEWNAPTIGVLRVDEILPRNVSATGGIASPASTSSAANEGPSICIGDALGWPVDPRPRCLPDFLRDAAARHPDQGVLSIEHSGELFMSYATLRDRAERVMAGLRRAGVRPRDTVIFEIDRNIDFIVALWGCFLGGFVPAPISVPVLADPASAAATKLKNVWELLEKPVVVTTAAVDDVLNALRGTLDMTDMRALTIEALSAEAPGEPWHAPQPDDVALMLLTSGSTGRPKAVTQTHAALDAHVAGMVQRYGFDDETVSLNWFPLDHVGGIVMCHLRDVSLGSRQIHVPTTVMLQDILAWLDLVDRHRVTMTWGPNFAYALVNERAGEVATRRWDLSSLTVIVNGGEAIAPSTARRFVKLLQPHRLPPSAMHPAWGMSETSSGQILSDLFRADDPAASNEFVAVGFPNPGFDIRIVDDDGRVVRQGSEGHLEVRGPVVTKGYLNNTEANAEAFTADGWFRTGDLGRILARDGLTITGREKSEIIVNGVNYPAHEIEAVAETVPGVIASFTAAFAVRGAGDATDSLAVALCTARTGDGDLADLLRTVRHAVVSRVGVQPRYLLLVDQSEIPKTAIGKIQRSLLAKQFAAGGFADAVKRSDELTKRTETIPDWFYRPVWKRRDAGAERALGAEATVVVLRDAFGVGERLAELARAAGASAVVCDVDAAPRAVAAAPSGGRVVVVMPCDLAPAATGIAVPDEAAIAIDTATAMRELIVGIAGVPGDSHRVEVLVHDRSTQFVIAGDRIDVGRSSVLGLLRTVPAEYPRMTIRHVDLGDGTAPQLAERLAAELADQRDEAEVAYRDGRRWVSRLARQSPRPREAASVMRRADGFVLVTGGLGGLGVEVCRQLLRIPGRHLLIVGRRPIGAATEHAASLAALESLGDVRYVSADVGDFAALERAVSDAAAIWHRPLTAAFHLAGEFVSRLIGEESAESIERSMRAKVRGAWNVSRVLARYPDAAFIGFSSVNGYLGGYAAAAYSAANAFIDRLATHSATVDGREAYAVGWTLWDGVGMSRGHAFKESAARRGYHAIEPQPGITSLAAALAGPLGHVLVGLDGSNPNVARLTDAPPFGERLTVRSRERGDSSASPFDRFGTPVPVALHEMRGVAGAVGAATTAAFTNAMEQTIAGVWCDVLSIAAVAANENFFDAGGTSLLVAAARRKLEDALSRPVAVTDLYRFPTVRLLAAHLGGAGTDEAAALGESEERGRARRAQRLERRRPST